MTSKNYFYYALIIFASCFIIQISSSLSLFSKSELRNEIEKQFIKYNNSGILDKWARVFSLSLIKRMQEASSERSKDERLTLVTLGTVIPPQADIVELPDLGLVSENGGPNSALMVGNIHFCNPTVTGLDTLDDFLSIEVNPPFIPVVLKLVYDFRLPEMKLSGKHAVGAELLGGLLYVESFDDFEISVENFYIMLNVSVKVKNDFFFAFDKVEIDMNSTEFKLFANHTIINHGENPVNWEELTSEIKDIYNSFWNVIRLVLGSVLKAVISEIIPIHQCGVQDIGDLAANTINATCLKNAKIVTNEMIEAEIGSLIDLNYNNEYVDGEIMNDDGEKAAVCTVKYTAPPTRATTPTTTRGTTTKKTNGGNIYKSSFTFLAILFLFTCKLIS